MTVMSYEALRSKVSEVNETLERVRGFVHGAELLAGELAVFEQRLDDDLQALATVVEKLRVRFNQMSGHPENLRKAS